MASISDKYSYNKNYIVWWVYVCKSYFLSLEEVFFWINSSQKVNNSSNSPFKCKDGLKIYLLSEKKLCMLTYHSNIKQASAYIWKEPKNFTVFEIS